MGIRIKLLLLMLLVVSLGSALFFGLQNKFIEYQFESYLHDEQEQSLPSSIQTADLVAVAYQMGGWSEVKKLINKYTMPATPALLLVITNNGEQFWTPKQLQIDEIIIEAEHIRIQLSDPLAGNKWLLLQTITTLKSIVVNSQEIGKILWLPLPQDSLSSPQLAFLSQARATTILLVVIFITLALTIVFFVGQRITRPLQDLSDANERIAKGDLGFQVKITSNDEVGQLAAGFNAMSCQLARTETLRKHMLSNVAHELRTPLTGLRCALEAMQDGVIQTSAGEIDNLFKDVLQLQKLVSDLQELSLAESQELNINSVPSNLQEILESSIRAIPFLNKNINCLLNCSQKLVINIDPQRLRQVMVNLLQNAYMHSFENGVVEINVEDNNKHILILVRDFGPGIDKSDIENIFERLFKTDQSRNNKLNTGNGLGLAISRELVILFGGELKASLPESGGMQFEIFLPL